MRGGLTVVDDADHHSIAGDVFAPRWHYVQVKAAGAVLPLRKLNTRFSEIIKHFKRTAAVRAAVLFCESQQSSHQAKCSFL